MIENRFDHIAFAVGKMADTTPFLVGELGGCPYEGGPGNGFRGGQWSYDGGGRLEVLEPVGPPDGFLYRFLEKNGPGLHHVTFKVPDLRKICQQAEALGYRIVGYDDSFPAWKEAFLHPKEALGIVVQIVESDPDFTDTWGPHWEFPPAPPPGSPAVRIVGLRFTARDPTAVHRQWGELLGGDLMEPRDGAQEGELGFHWPGSAMRIAVTLNPGQPDSPQWVEVATQRPVALHEGPHPVLGARFVPVPWEEQAHG